MSHLNTLPDHVTPPKMKEYEQADRIVALKRQLRDANKKAKDLQLDVEVFQASVKVQEKNINSINEWEGAFNEQERKAREYKEEGNAALAKVIALEKKVEALKKNNDGLRTFVREHCK